MRPLEVVFITLLGFSIHGACSPPRYPVKTLASSGIVHDGNIADKYDFVIVGGGQAGLVLASRLSEDSNTTVLVLEAGDTGESIADNINPPAYAYYKSMIGSPYDYGYHTVPQAALANRAIPWPRGKLLGGSSAINGMYLVRPSEIEVNAWSSMIAPQDGTPSAAWGWTNFYAAMKKSEIFTPPSDAIKAEAGIQYDASLHGTSGPLHHSYPGYSFTAVGNWTTTLANVGIPPNPDGSGGSNWGGYIAMSAINPTNWTRSYSKSAYIDPLPPRGNLAILANATVTRLIFSPPSPSSNLTASAVEFASDRDAAKRTVNVNKEVILAGGAIGSPQVLMLSGVGPRDVLEAAGITVVNELPGVGQHLQDHLSTGVAWQTSTDTAGGIYASGSSIASTPEFLSYVNSATGYANLTTLLGNDAAADLRSKVVDALSASSSSLTPSSNAEVIEGYKAIYNVITNTILPSQVGQIELLLSLHAPGSIGVQAALQHPLSQGRLYINSSSAFDAPVIDPNYLSHFADLTIMREGLKLARKVGQTEPLKSFLGDETSPGPNVNSDDEWNAWLANAVSTEFHPAATCAMLPKSLGGVVNANLQVYGLANVRVADASIYPFAFSAHLGAPTYGLTEQAASIIRSFYNGASSSSNSAPTSNSTSSPQKSGAIPSFSPRTLWAIIYSFVAGLLISIS